MEQSATTKEIFTALSNAQAEMRAAPKDAVNPHFKSRYADLTSIWDAIREPLTKNGLSVVQSVMQVEHGIAVQTQINHKSGEWIRMDACPIPLDKSNAQGAGSAITYGKRYSLAAAVGIVADDDDDGAAASQGQQKKPQGNNQQQRPPQQQKPEPPADNKPAEEPLSQKDNRIIADIVQSFAEAKSEYEFNEILGMLKTPGSSVNKADNVSRVKKQIWDSVKGHKFAPKDAPPQQDYVPEHAQA